MAEQGHWKKFTDDEGFTFEAWMGSGPAPKKEREYGEGQNTSEIQNLVDFLKEHVTDGKEPTQADFNRFFAQDNEILERIGRKSTGKDGESISRERFGLEERDDQEAIKEDITKSQLDQNEQIQRMEMETANESRARKNEELDRQRESSAERAASAQSEMEGIGGVPTTAPASTTDPAPTPESSGSNIGNTDQMVKHLNAIEETLKSMDGVLKEINERFEDEGIRITL